MTVFRHHLLGIILFPISLMLLVVPGCMLALRLNTPRVAFLLPILGPVVLVVGVAAVLGLTQYHTAVARRRAEWSVLAPVLAFGLMVGMHINAVAGNVLGWGPRNVLRPPGTVESAVTFAFIALAACVACAAAASWWMKGFPAKIGTGVLKQELIALGILIPFSLWPRTAAARIAEWVGWGIGTSFAEAWQNAHLRLALRSGAALAAIVVPCVLIALLLWRRRPACARWQGIALVSMWAVTSAWLNQMYRFIWRLDYDNWLQALGLGVIAAGVALTYVHGVVLPLCRKARQCRPDVSAKPSDLGAG